MKSLVLLFVLLPIFFPFLFIRFAVSLEKNQNIDEAGIYVRIQISAVARIRHALALATHTFFDNNGFLWVHTPIITTSDCEGAGEMFQVTTLFSEAERRDQEYAANPPPTEAEVEASREAVLQKGEILKDLKSQKKNKKEIEPAVQVNVLSPS